MSQKIVGNFVVGTVYSSDDSGKWNGAWVVRRYGVNNGQVIAMKTLEGGYGSCEEAKTQAMVQGEAFAKGLSPEAGNGNGSAPPGSGDELFIPPSSQPQPATPPAN